MACRNSTPINNYSSPIIVPEATRYINSQQNNIFAPRNLNREEINKLSIPTTPTTIRRKKGPRGDSAIKKLKEKSFPVTLSKVTHPVFKDRPNIASATKNRQKTPKQVFNNRPNNKTHTVKKIAQKAQSSPIEPITLFPERIEQLKVPRTKKRKTSDENQVIIKTIKNTKTTVRTIRQDGSAENPVVIAETSEEVIENTESTQRTVSK